MQRTNKSFKNDLKFKALKNSENNSKRRILKKNLKFNALKNTVMTKEQYAKLP